MEGVHSNGNINHAIFNTRKTNWQIPSTRRTVIFYSKINERYNYVIVAILKYDFDKPLKLGDFSREGLKKEKFKI